MRRYPDWPARLQDFFASRAKLPFSWGSNDCCLFAGDAILAMTGEDLTAHLRSRYCTARGAVELLREHGQLCTIGDLAFEMARKHGIREVPPLFAQRGDVMLVDRELGESLGVVSLAGNEICAPGEEGLVCLPFREGRRAWRI